MKHDTELKTATQKPLWQRRWWTRTKLAYEPEGCPEYPKLPEAVYEFYIPWWGWPFELVHRAIFGRVKMKAIECKADGVMREYDLT